MFKNAFMTRSTLLRTIDDEALFGQLKALVATIPSFVDINDDDRRWLGRLSALVEETRNISDTITLTYEVSKLNKPLVRDGAVAEIKNILFRALAHAELGAPSGVQGAFIAAGNPYDAYSAVAKILAECKAGALIVDPYMDQAVFDFSLLAPEGCRVRLLADAGTHKDSLKPALARWIEQHGAARPIELRLAPKRALHDRSILVDGESAWVSTQSFNALAKRSPASLSRLDGDAGQLKIAAYEAIWDLSEQS